MNQQKKIRAVIFDMGGVILRTENQAGRRKWEKQLGLSDGELSRRVFTSQASELCAIGKLTEDAVWQEIAAQLKLDDTHMRELIRDFWAGDHVDLTLTQFIRDLRPRYKTAILSNAWTTGRWAITEKFGLGALTDTIITSAEEGVAKPDARIYRIALERLQVQPAEAIFVDDVAQNVQGAQAVGICGVQFFNTAQAIAEVEQWLAQDRPPSMF